MTNVENNNIKIHIHSRNGLYTLVSYSADKIKFRTKHDAYIRDASDYKCLAGGNHNFRVNMEVVHEFERTVLPEKYAELDRKEAELMLQLDAIRHEEYLEQLYLELAEAEMQKDMEDAELHQQWIEDQYYEEPYDIEQDLRNYVTWYNQTKEELDKLRDHNIKVARKVYDNFNPRLSDIEKPIKFIVQTNNKGSFRIRFDYYGFVENYHSSISQIFSDGIWCTMNGGWMRIEDGKLQLYGRSGDYGIFDKNIALDCAEKLFPMAMIDSKPGAELDLPF